MTFFKFTNEFYTEENDVMKSTFVYTGKVDERDAELRIVDIISADFGSGYTVVISLGHISNETFRYQLEDVEYDAFQSSDIPQWLADKIKPFLEVKGYPILGYRECCC